MPGTCGTSYVKILLFSLSRTRIFDAHASSQEGKLDETRALQQTAYPREANCSIYLRRVAKNPSQALSRRDIENALHDSPRGRYRKNTSDLIPYYYVNPAYLPSPFRTLPLRPLMPAFAFTFPSRGREKFLAFSQLTFGNVSC